MDRKQLWDVGETPTIRIERIEGDLLLQGWAQPQLQVESGGELSVNLSTSPINVRCSDDTVVRLPIGSSIEILNVDGDLQATDLIGGLTLGAIHGDARLREIGALAVTVVHGELSAQAVEGDCHLRRVHDSVTLSRVRGNIRVDAAGNDCTVNDVLGNVHVSAGDDCTVNQVQGQVHVHAGDEVGVNNVQGDVHISAGSDCAVEQVQGHVTANAGSDLNIQHIQGNLHANAGSDASLRLNPLPGCEYRVNAGSDITCRLAQATNAKVNLQAGGTISVRKLEGAAINSGHSANFTLGDGSATLAFTAGGDISIGGQAFDHEPNVEFEFNFGGGSRGGPDFANTVSDFTRQILSQVEVGLRSMGRKLDMKLSNLGSGDEIAGRVQEKVQAAMHKAEEKVAEAIREAERRAREAEARMAEMQSRQPRRPGFGWQGHPGHPGHPPVPPVPPTPPSPPRAGKAKAAANPVSEEERLMILRMVSEGKISVEQAEQLLSALSGGKGGD